MSEVISSFFKHNGKPKLALSPQQLKARAEILNHIHSGKYCYEHANCAICDSDNSSALLTTEKYGIETHIHECLDCFLVYNKFRFTDSTLFDIYQNSYRRIEKPPENTSPQQLFSQEYLKGCDIYSKIGKYLQSGLVVEVGCGSGGTLQYFKEQGYQVIGYDLDEEYLNYGINYGLDLKRGEINPKDISHTVSAIILEQCLEHIIDVNLFLEKISKIVNPDTIIYIGVPGIRNIHIGYSGNVLEYFAFFHLYHFDKRSLSVMMKKYGFYAVYLDEIICGIFKKNKTDLLQIVYKESVSDYLKKSLKMWQINRLKNLFFRACKYPFKYIRKKLNQAKMINLI